MTQSQLTLADLQTMIDALACLERSLFHLHHERAKYHPQTYAGIAEGTVDEILKLRAQIDETIGLTEFAAPARMYHPMPTVEGWDKDVLPPAVNGAYAGAMTGETAGFP